MALREYLRTQRATRYSALAGLPKDCFPLLQACYTALLWLNFTHKAAVPKKIQQYHCSRSDGIPRAQRQSIALPGTAEVKALSGAPMYTTPPREGEKAAGEWERKKGARARVGVSLNAPLRHQTRNLFRINFGFGLLLQGSVHSAGARCIPKETACWVDPAFVLGAYIHALIPLVVAV